MKKKEENIQFEHTQIQREIVIERLKEMGCRITKQRLILLDIILSKDCSCCKEIFYEATKKDKGIGQSTVYRMVSLLEEIGAINRKNMYKISCGCGDNCGKEEICQIELDDHTICHLSPQQWKAVLKAGLEQYGYIGEQEICCVNMVPCECETC